MSLIGSILGSLGGSSDSELDVAVGANPQLDVSASDVLDVGGGGGLVPSVSVLDGLDVGLSAPVLIGVHASSEASADAGGGLLGGLL